MEAKQKAKELFFKMLYHYNGNIKIQRQSTAKAKECALICVDEIMKQLPITCISEIEAKEYKYWSKVKQEILNL